MRFGCLLIQMRAEALEKLEKAFSYLLHVGVFLGLEVLFKVVLYKSNDLKAFDICVHEYVHASIKILFFVLVCVCCKLLNSIKKT